MSLFSTRESIISDLFAKLSSVTFLQPVTGKTTFVTTSRRLKLWTDVPRNSRPALYMTCHGESFSYKTENTPAVVKFNVKIWVYLDTSDTTTAPDSDINVVLDAIDKVLNPGPGEQRLTLNGKVSHCRIDGEVFRDPGDLDNDGLIIIPISISTT